MSNLVFFGTPSFAVPALRLLADSLHRPVAVITAPDKPVGRKQILTPSPVALEAERLGLPVIKLASLKDDASWAKFEALQASICVVVAYGKLIPQRYLDAVPRGWLNIHPSRLPELRGPSPVASAILRGIDQSAISIMLLDSQQDHGPIVAQESWNIPAGATTAQAEAEASERGAQLLMETLDSYLAGSITPQAQNDARATTTAKFTREDGRVNWSLSADRVLRQWRALGHNPGVWTLWEGAVLNLRELQPTNHHAQNVGTVHMHGNELHVACSDACVAITSIQKEGSTRQSAEEFVRGHAQIVGSALA